MFWLHGNTITCSKPFLALETEVILGNAAPGTCTLTFTSIHALDIIEVWPVVHAISSKNETEIIVDVILDKYTARAGGNAKSDN